MPAPKHTARQLAQLIKAAFPFQVNLSGLTEAEGNVIFKCSFDPSYGSETVYVYVNEDRIGWRIVNTKDLQEQQLCDDDSIQQAAGGINSILQGWTTME